MTSPDSARLPAGTVTFLFLDIERSTEHLELLGADYPQLLELYRDLTERAVSDRGGVIFGSEGDGLFIAFPGAGAAALSAVDAQLAYAKARWPRASTVLVRMGIHTGTPTLIGNDYTGLDVHRTARIMASAWGGQILLSDVTYSLLARPGVICRELGWYDMKGLTRPERIYQLEAPSLPSEFPPVRARNREVDLPAYMTEFIGRDDDISAILDLLDSGARLVTLTGPGGIGKSRIAAAAAARLGSSYPDGVSFVDLSNETDPDRVPAAIGEKIGIPAEPDHDPLEVLINHLAEMEMLLILDGFERVAGAAVSIATVLSRCPKLRLLVTSRGSLRIGAEREFRVDPLGWATEGANFGQIGASPAVQLFVDRARIVQPDFELTPENAHVIRDLVERLDGCPLAIELAAARARLLPPEEILDRLEVVLDLSTSSPELPTRQRSLRATIEWSHGLLDEADQRLFRRLGVFVDGWALEAAEAVAGDSAPDVFLGLETLVGQSMISVESGGRMTMGTAMREFALEQLAVSGDEEETRLRHAEHYDAIVVESEPLLRGRRQRETVVKLSREWRNLRTAADWAMETGRVQLAGSIYVRTWIVAWQGDNWTNVKGDTGRLMELSDRLDDSLRAPALFVAAGTYMEMGEPETAISYARPAVELASRIGDKETEAWARLMIAGSILFNDSFSQEARAQISAAVELAESLDDPFVLGYATSFHAAMLTVDGDIESALQGHARVLAIAIELDNVSLIIQTYCQAALTHLAAGDRVRAREVLEAAAEYLDRLRSLEGLALFLDTVSWLAFTEQDPVRAMTALGAANAARARVGLVRWALVAILLESAGMAAEAETPELAEARRVGSEMVPHDAIGFALQPHHELATAG
jgi:predicted ATPase/class 3 adenylate cyclase